MSEKSEKSEKSGESGKSEKSGESRESGKSKKYVLRKFKYKFPDDAEYYHIIREEQEKLLKEAKEEYDKNKSEIQINKEVKAYQEFYANQWRTN